MAEKSHAHRQVVRWAKSTNRVLALGSIAIVGSIGARLFRRGDSVDVWELGEIPVQLIWWIFVGWTVVHMFVAHFFRRAVQSMLVSTEDEAARRAAWEDVVNDGGHFVGVTSPRIAQPGQRVVQMSWSDASTWFAHIASVGLYLAMLPWWIDNGVNWADSGWTAAIASIALAVVVANWLIGGSWAIQLSALASESASGPMVAGATDKAGGNGGEESEAAG